MKKNDKKDLGLGQQNGMQFTFKLQEVLGFNLWAEPLKKI